MIPKPTHRHYNLKRNTSLLYFDDNEFPIEFYMRGGVCFPIQYEILGRGMDTNGFALMAGLNLSTGVVTVFEQAQWVTIDDILDKENQTIRFPGLSHWLNMIWNQYFARAYYWCQEEELARRYRLQILRSMMIDPKPWFYEIHAMTPNDIVSCIWRYTKTGRIIIERDSELAAQLGQAQKGDKQILPAVYALGCCLTGIDLYPFRAPVEEVEKEVLVRW